MQTHFGIYCQRCQIFLFLLYWDTENVICKEKECVTVVRKVLRGKNLRDHYKSNHAGIHDKEIEARQRYFELQMISEENEALIEKNEELEIKNNELENKILKLAEQLEIKEDEQVLKQRNVRTYRTSCRRTRREN